MGLLSFRPSTIPCTNHIYIRNTTRIGRRAYQSVLTTARQGRGYPMTQAGRGTHTREDRDMARDPRWTPQWKRLRLECYARDRDKNARCVHCGQPIDYTVPPSSTDDSYEPDHRITVAKHPEWALLPENIQPTHRRCNRARGNKAGINNLGRRTRDWTGGLGVFRS